MKMQLIAIDPGPTQSALLVWDGHTVLKADILDNDACRDFLYNYDYMPYTVCVEMVACYGMAVGKEVFETCLMIGRIQEIASQCNSSCRLIYRRDVKMHLCGNMRAKDTNIRQALVDKLGPVGTKKNRGPLFGVHSHLWAALGVAVTASEITKETA